MARKSPKGINARATRRSRPAQPSRIFSANTIAHDALTRQRQSAQQSDLEGLHANDKRNFPTEVSPLLVLASLNAIESAISYSTGQIIDEQTEATRDTILRDETTEIVHSPRPGQDEAYVAPSDHDDSLHPERKMKPMSRGEMEGGKDRKHLEGKKHKKKSAGQKAARQKDTSNSEDSEEPTDADKVVKQAEPEKKRDGIAGQNGA